MVLKYSNPKNLKYLLGAICFVAFSSNFCFSQQDSAPYLEATVNGNTIIAKNEGFSQVYGKLVKMPGFFQLFVTGVTIDDEKAKGVTMQIISEKPFSSVTNGTQWNTNNKALDDLPIGSYFERQDDVEVATTSETTQDAYLKITAIDKVNKSISGEFSFTAKNEDGTGNNIVKVTNGVFKNVPY